MPNYCKIFISEEGLTFKIVFFISGNVPTYHNMILDVP